MSDPQPEPLAPKEEESDLWWGGYDPRALLPGVLLCLLLTIGIIILTWGVWIEWANQSWKSYRVREITYFLIAALWLIQLGRWMARLVAISYRLTTHRLFLERSFRPCTGEVVELAAITDIAIEQKPWERGLNVGRIRITSQKPGMGTIFLPGVFMPERIATMMRKAVRKRHAGRGGTCETHNV